jgi:hypothetical protein
MKEGAPPDLYQPRTPRQHQFFIQLEMACDVDDWIRRWHPTGPGELVACVRGADGFTRHLDITPRFQLGVRKIIFARLMDLTAEGHGREAMEIVVGWRTPPPPEKDQ